jgi:carbon-monoxide dehydrogenase medium subunit
VKPPSFAYHRPRCRAEVDALLHEHGDDGRLLAGGQTLVPQLANRAVRPGHVVDVNHLDDEPTAPVVEADTVHFGPLVRMSALGRDSALGERLPVLRDILRQVATPAVRNRATVVGNLVAGDRSSELPALFTLLGGSARIRGRDGTSDVDLADTVPQWIAGRAERSRWVEEVVVRLPAAGTAMTFAETGRRFASRAAAGVVVAAEPVAGGSATVSAVVYGCCATPGRIELGEVGPEAESGVAERVERALAPLVDEVDDHHGDGPYRRFVAAAMTVRCVRDAVATCVRGGAR